MGKAVNELPTTPDEAKLDTFPNRHQVRNYTVEFDCVDFMSMCPITQQSDFAKIHIQYIPADKCIETKSLKFYLQSFRSQKMFNEEIVNRILTDLVGACSPKWMKVKGAFAARGGISLTATAEHPSREI
ncbi:MAG TPA: NADPH-dependent 7-cyano-7-deazaguanine reductase QueF [Phaeodactylibacter sp.]|nr:NADPH-dependent 7-cyano-7-deazaguanine reductase QueF [Phaeodactylibacter sp.]